MKKVTVLIIEDDPLQAMVEKRMLEKLGYEVVATFKSAEEGYDAIKALHPDIIMTDNRLKGELDGFDLVRILRDENITTPIIFVTGESSASHKTLASLPNIVYLVKPILFGTLINALETFASTVKNNVTPPAT